MTDQQYRLVEISEFTFGTGIFASNQLKSLDVAISGDQIAFAFTDNSWKSDEAVAIEFFDIANPVPGNSMILLAASDGEVSIEAAADGGFLVAYEMPFTQETKYREYLQFLNSDGTLNGDPIEAFDIHYEHINLTGLEGGGYVSVWDQTIDGESYLYNRNIYAQFYSETGTALTSVLRINTETERSENNPEAWALPNGNVLITWIEATYNTNGGNTRNEKLFGRIYSPDGSALTSPVLLGIDPDGQYYAGYDIGISPNGNIIVSLGAAQSDPQVQVYNQNLTAIDEQQVIYEVPGWTYLDSATANLVSVEDGLYVAHWYASHLQPVLAGVFTEDGTLVSELYERDGLAVDDNEDFNGESELLPNGDILFYQYDHVDDIGLAEIFRVNALATGEIVVTGQAYEGDELVANVSGATDREGIEDGSRSYQWYRDGVAVDGATALTYVLTQEDVGAEIAMLMTYTDGDGIEETLWSETSLPVENDNDLPEGEIAISGEAVRGEKLVVENLFAFTDEDGLDYAAVAYQWLRGGAPIEGATEASYTLVDADVGAAVSVRVSYTDDFGAQESVTSAETDAVVVGPQTLTGTEDGERLAGDMGNDTIYGMDGADTLIGMDGDDLIYGGDTKADLKDEVYGGNGNDLIDGGYGNDALRGDAGNDTILGGYGVDTIIGGDGDDDLTGQTWSDLIFGGDGDDFINGGFGFDRVNGGTGADRFYHIGHKGHGSDWIQDYDAASGDLLVYGGAGAVKDDFLVQTNFTPLAGAADVAEVFITHKSSGVLLWALVDGDAQSSLNLVLNGETFDLLA
jgi:Ca2+-binding RTX toxin-like protein